MFLRIYIDHLCFLLWQIQLLQCNLWKQLLVTVRWTSPSHTMLSVSLLEFLSYPTPCSLLNRESPSDSPEENPWTVQAGVPVRMQDNFRDSTAGEPIGANRLAILQPVSICVKLLSCYGIRIRDPLLLVEEACLDAQVPFVSQQIFPTGIAPMSLLHLSGTWEG